MTNSSALIRARPTSPLLALLLVAPLHRPVSGVRDEAAVLRAVRLRLQPAARLHRPAVVRPCGLLRQRGLRHRLAGRRRRAGRPNSASSPAWPSPALLGLVVGLVAIRRQGIYFAMITLALAQMVFFVCLQAPFTGGEDGLQGVPRGNLFGLLPLASDTDACTTWCWRSSSPASCSSAHRALAVRPGAQDDPRERAARRLAGLRGRPLQAAGLRALGRRWPGWPARSRPWCWASPR